jgi:ABC-2 type transport system permease protein
MISRQMAINCIRELCAILLRDLRLKIRYKFALISSFIWPIIFPLSFVFMGHGLAGKKGEGLSNFSVMAGTSDYVSFLVIGAIFWLFFDNIVISAGIILRNEQILGIFDTHWSLPINRYVYLTETIISSTLLSSVPVIIGFGFYIMIGMLPIKGLCLSVFFVLLCSLPFSIGLLLILCSFSLRYKETNSVRIIVRSCLSLLCGFLFPISCLWQPLQKLAYILPLTHVINAFRNIMINGADIQNSWNDLGFAFTVGIVFLIIGIAYISKTVRYIKKTGTTGFY